MSKLNSLATLFRAAQFYAHGAHNLVTGETFLIDHKYLGTLYDAYEEAYDSLIERIIGTDITDTTEKFNLVDITKNAVKLFADTFPEKGSAEAYFKGLNAFEIKIRAIISKINGDLSLGTQNLVQDLADQSEQRSYKLQQRVV